ncbi:hypothetical protein HG1285_14779 [Hydrogenivirga sp. 128-5-R1-1]|nr:hypothetical protein HG1285_14779 [Hydrogenivirga sp. 128-5-R1-1]
MELLCCKDSYVLGKLKELLIPLGKVGDMQVRSKNSYVLGTDEFLNIAMYWENRYLSATLLMSFCRFQVAGSLENNK